MSETAIELYQKSTGVLLASRYTFKKPLDKVIEKTISDLYDMLPDAYDPCDLSVTYYPRDDIIKNTYTVIQSDDGKLTLLKD